MSSLLDHNPARTAAVVGGGLVGCLLAIYLREKHGFEVSIYEGRDDPREQAAVLALDHATAFVIDSDRPVIRRRVRLELCRHGQHVVRALSARRGGLRDSSRREGSATYE